MGRDGLEWGGTGWKRGGLGEIWWNGMGCKNKKLECFESRFQNCHPLSRYY